MMNISKPSALIIAAILLAACGASHSGVLPMGSHTYSYRIEATDESSAKTKREGVEEATEFCEDEGKNFMFVKDETGTGGKDNEALYYDITFTCEDE